MKKKYIIFYIIIILSLSNCTTVHEFTLKPMTSNNIEVSLNSADRTAFLITIFINSDDSISNFNFINGYIQINDINFILEPENIEILGIEIETNYIIISEKHGVEKFNIESLNTQLMSRSSDGIITEINFQYHSLT